MTLHEPFEITPRLLPGLKIGGAWVALEHVGDAGGRMVYRWYIDLADGTEHSEADLKSGVQGASYQEMFGTLLCFLSACADSRDYGTRTGCAGESAELFPDAVGAWAEEFQDDIQHYQCMIEEGGEVLIAE